MHIHEFCCVSSSRVPYKSESFFNPQNFGILQSHFKFVVAAVMCFVHSIKPKCFYYSNNYSQNERNLFPMNNVTLISFSTNTMRVQHHTIFFEW